MSKAPLELLGFLPRPPKAESEGVATLLHGDLLAYASFNSVVVVDVSPGLQRSSLAHLFFNPVTHCFSAHRSTAWNKLLL